MRYRNSRLALDSLERLSEREGPGNNGVEVVQAFANDIDKLRNDIGGILETLREGVNRAEVLQENISSSDNRLVDVDTAQAEAKSAGQEISFSSEQAIDAHSSLSPERVSSLLSE